MTFLCFLDVGEEISAVFFPLAMLSQYVFGPALFLLSLFIVLIILLQRGRGGGLTGALGGAGGASCVWGQGRRYLYQNHGSCRFALDRFVRPDLFLVPARQPGHHRQLRVRVRPLEWER